MQISFDPDKRAKTLRERGLDFADAGTVFEGPVYTAEDDRFDYPAMRYTTFGLLDGQMAMLVWTQVPGGRQVISMSKANDKEQARDRKRLG